MGSIRRRSTLFPMSTIYQDELGISAFTSGNKIVMNFNQPVVSTYLRASELERWLTTLEEVITKDASAHNRHDLEGIYFSLKAAHTRHLQEHEDVVTEAPTADDLQAYLTAYAAAVGGQR